MVNVKQLIREKEGRAEELPAEPKNKNEMKTSTPTPQKDVPEKTPTPTPQKDVPEQNRTKTLEVTRREEEVKDVDERPTVHMRQLIRENKLTTEEPVQTKWTNTDTEGHRRDDAITQHVAYENEEMKSQTVASRDRMQRMKQELQDIRDERCPTKVWWGTIHQISTEHSDYINKMRTADTKVHRMETELGAQVNVVELLKEKEALKEQLRVVVLQNQELKGKIKETESKVEGMEGMIRLLKEERMRERQRFEEKIQLLQEGQEDYLKMMSDLQAKVMIMDESMSMLEKKKERKMKQVLAQQSPIGEMNKDTKGGTKTPEDHGPKKQDLAFKDTREELSKDMGKTVEEKLHQISTEQSRDMAKMQTTVNQVQKIKTMFSQITEDTTEIVEEVKDDEYKCQRLEQIPEEYNKSVVTKMNVQGSKGKTENMKQLDKITNTWMDQLNRTTHDKADMENKLRNTEENVLKLGEQVSQFKEQLRELQEIKVQSLEQKGEATQPIKSKRRRPRRERSPSPEPKRLEIWKTTAEHNVPPPKDVKERSKTPEGSKLQKTDEFTSTVNVRGLIRIKEGSVELQASPVPKSPEMRSTDYIISRDRETKEVQNKETGSREEEPTLGKMRRNVFPKGQSPHLELRSPEMKKEETVKRAESRVQEPELGGETSTNKVQQLIGAFQEPPPSPEPRIEEAKPERVVRKVEEKMRVINKEPTKKSKEDMTQFSTNKECRMSKEEEMPQRISVKRIIRSKEIDDNVDKIKDIKEESKATEVTIKVPIKVPKSEEETRSMRQWKKETVRESRQLPSLEQSGPPETEETPINVKQMVKQMVKQKEAIIGPEPKIEETKTPEKQVKTPTKTIENRPQVPEKHLRGLRDKGPNKTTENRVPGLEDMTPLVKARNVFRGVQASPEPKNEDMKYPTKTREKNVPVKDNKGARREDNKGARREEGVDKRLQWFTAEQDGHMTRALKAEETAMASSVKRLIRQNETLKVEQVEPSEEERTVKNERPHVLPGEQNYASKTPYFSVPNKTVVEEPFKATEGGIEVSTLEEETRKVRQQIRRKEISREQLPAEGDPWADEFTDRMVDLNQQIREKDMRDEMKTHNVHKIEEIKNMGEEQRIRSPSPQLISQCESRQPTASRNEDIRAQINTTVHLQVEEKVQDIELENLMLHFCPLTYDKNTASKRLALSNDNRTVTNVSEAQVYPYHSERFDYWSQVMCKEGLTGCCYWEVDWNLQVSIAVAYKSIPRRGHSDIGLLGFNDKSWSLDCSGAPTSPGDGNKYTVRHNNHKEELAVNPSGSNRVGVYLNWPAGKLSFYCVSSDRRLHLYTFQCTFTEPLHCAIWCWTIDSSVSLCQREDIQ